MRSRLLLPLTLCLGVVACTDSMSGPTLPVANQSLVPPQAASVLIDLAGACGLLDGDGNLVVGLDADINVFTESPNGNAVHNCHARVPNSSGRAVHYDSENNPFGVRIACTIFDDQGNGRITFHLQETVSASGQARLTCVVHP